MKICCYNNTSMAEHDRWHLLKKGMECYFCSVMNLEKNENFHGRENGCKKKRKREFFRSTHRRFSMGQRPLFEKLFESICSLIIIIMLRPPTAIRSRYILPRSFVMELSFFFPVVYDHLHPRVFDHPCLPLSNPYIMFDESLRKNFSFHSMTFSSEGIFLVNHPRLHIIKPSNQLFVLLENESSYSPSSRTAHRQTSRPSMSTTRDPPVQSRPYARKQKTSYSKIVRLYSHSDRFFHVIKLIHRCHRRHDVHQQVWHVNPLFSKIILFILSSISFDVSSKQHEQYGDENAVPTNYSIKQACE